VTVEKFIILQKIRFQTFQNFWESRKISVFTKIRSSKSAFNIDRLIKLIIRSSYQSDFWRVMWLWRLE